jgi:hypothetical protein
VLGSATSAHASVGVPPAQSDIIAVLKSEVGSAAARKAGGHQGE